MQCNLCNKNPATVHLTEIIDDQMTELHLCDDCARKKSLQMEQQFGLSDLLGGLVEYGKHISGTGDKTAPVAQCSACGLTYEDFRKVGRLGCSACYENFSKHLGPLLKRIHGATQHTGKTPLHMPVPPSSPATAAPKVPGGGKVPEGGTVPGGGKTAARPKPVDLAAIKAKLQDAITREEFEEAARLRDLIKELERKKKGSPKKDGSE